MNKAQIAVIGVALAAGAAAFMLVNGEPEQNAQAPVQQIVKEVPVDKVLVATRDLSYGTEITQADVDWIEWPKASLPAGVLTKSGNPDAVEELKASFVRIPFSAGEPLRKDRLIKGVTAGLMSTMLSPGMRAVAIDVSLNTTAGGFILPNDRVDVLRTFRDAEASKDQGREAYGSEVLLSNVRVLAVGQAIEKKGSEAVAAGSTATLELTPAQAEFIVLAQRGGLLTLMLRPIFDARAKTTDEEKATDDGRDEALTLIRRGIAATLRSR